MSLYGFPKKEHLCGKTNFQLLFKEGSSYYVPSFRLVCRNVSSGSPGIQVGVVVSKRVLRHAVDRNRVKRLMREAYRLRKPVLQAMLEGNPYQWQLLFVYTGHGTPDFAPVQSAINVLLSKWLKKLTHETEKKSVTE